LDISDEVGRCPIHRVYEYWREEEVEYDAWGDLMSGAGTNGLDRGSDPREGPKHGLHGDTKQDLKNKPSPLKSLKQLPISVNQKQHIKIFIFIIYT
jgi:hypothetical protein